MTRLSRGGAAAAAADDDSPKGGGGVCRCGRRAHTEMIVVLVGRCVKNGEGGGNGKGVVEASAAPNADAQRDAAQRDRDRAHSTSPARLTAVLGSRRFSLMEPHDHPRSRHAAPGAPGGRQAAQSRAHLRMHVRCHLTLAAASSSLLTYTCHLNENKAVMIE